MNWGSPSLPFYLAALATPFTSTGQAESFVFKALILFSDLLWEFGPVSLFAEPFYFRPVRFLCSKYLHFEATQKTLSAKSLLITSYESILQTDTAKLALEADALSLYSRLRPNQTSCSPRTFLKIHKKIYRSPCSSRNTFSLTNAESPKSSGKCLLVELGL